MENIRKSPRRAKRSWIDPNSALAELSQVTTDQLIKPVPGNRDHIILTEYEADTDKLIRKILKGEFLSSK